MGVERVVRFTRGPVPGWPAVHDRLVAAGETPAVRMIDGLPAFPDETPPDDWRELRVGFPGGMVTLRRLPSAIALVTWGTADEALRRSWDVLAWACAAAGRGVVEGDAGPDSADEFARKLSGFTPPS